MAKNNASSRSLAPFVLLGIGVILVLAAIFWVIELGSQGSPIVSQPAVSTRPEKIPLPDIERVSLSDAYAAFEGGQAVFLDVRFPENYAEGHIPGAVLIPEPEVTARLDELDPNQWIIPYCT